MGSPSVVAKGPRSPLVIRQKPSLRRALAEVPWLLTMNHSEALRLSVTGNITVEQWKAYRWAWCWIQRRADGIAGREQFEFFLRFGEEALARRHLRVRAVVDALTHS